jgi:hypothetical protein
MITDAMKRLNLTCWTPPEDLYRKETHRRLEVKRQEIQELRSLVNNASDPVEKAELEASVLRSLTELTELAYHREVDGLLEFHTNPDVAQNVYLGYVPAPPRPNPADCPRISPLGFRFRDVRTEDVGQPEAILQLRTESDDRLVQLKEAKRMIKEGEMLDAYTTMRNRFRAREISLLLAQTLGGRMGIQLFTDLHTMYDYTE